MFIAVVLIAFSDLITVLKVNKLVIKICVRTTTVVVNIIMFN